jgi:hypothetical protein
MSRGLKRNLDPLGGKLVFDVGVPILPGGRGIVEAIPNGRWNSQISVLSAVSENQLQNLCIMVILARFQN